MVSDAKKRCIYAVSKELGIDVNWNGLDKLSEEEASRRIDELKTKLDSTRNATGDNPKTHEFNSYRFGMCVKIIFDKYPYLYLRAKPAVFIKEVKDSYNLVALAERELRTPSTALDDSDASRIPITTLADTNDTKGE